MLDVIAVTVLLTVVSIYLITWLWCYCVKDEYVEKLEHQKKLVNALIGNNVEGDLLLTELLKNVSGQKCDCQCC
jgi:hypothetical protein